MPLEYVSLTEAKKHCRVSHSNDDNDILLKIYAASAIVKNYMGEFSVYEPERDSTDDDITVDSNWEPLVNVIKTVRSEVKVAVLILVQKMYDQEYNFEHGKLPPEITAILYPLRDPACA